MKLKPARVFDLVVTVLTAAIATWIVTRVAYGRFPPISVFAGASLYPVAAIEVALAFVIRQRVQDDRIGTGPRRLHPITAARAVALAKASIQVGALVSGIWLGFLLWVFPRSGTLDAAAADAPSAVVGLIAGLCLLAAALWLEYCCRAPDDPTDDAATT